MTSQAVTVRFHLECEADQAAWAYLQQIHRQEHLSLGRAMIHALNEMANAELTSTKQTEMARQFAERILSELQTTLPAFIAGCIAGNAGTVSTGGIAMPIAAQGDSLPTALPDEESSQPDFSHSQIDWGFSGT